MNRRKYLDIVKSLRRNSRESLTNISRKINAPVSTTHDRVKAVEERFVNKHTSLVDFKKLGFMKRANLLLRSYDYDTINDFIVRSKNINSAFFLEGNHNFLLDCVFKDEIEMEQFMKEIECIQIESKEVYPIKEELKREGFLN